MNSQAQRGYVPNPLPQAQSATMQGGMQSADVGADMSTGMGGMMPQQFIQHQSEQFAPQQQFGGTPQMSGPANFNFDDMQATQLMSNGMQGMGSMDGVNGANGMQGMGSMGSMNGMSGMQNGTGQSGQGGQSGQPMSQMTQMSYMHNINLFHMLFVAPLLLFVGWRGKKGTLPKGTFNALMGLSAIVFLFHGYRFVV